MFWNRLLGKAGADQLDQAVNCSLLIGTISNDANGGAADDAQAQDAEQRLRINAALLLLDPDGRLILVRLLDEELLKIICPCVSTVGDFQAVYCVLIRRLDCLYFILFSRFCTVENCNFGRIL